MRNVTLNEPMNFEAEVGFSPFINITIDSAVSLAHSIFIQAFLIFRIEMVHVQISRNGPK